MKTLTKYPCSKCHKLSNGNIIKLTVIGKKYLITFKLECCNTKFTQMFTELDLIHYLK